MAGPGDTPQIQSEASVKLEEPDFSSANWYFSREEVEKYGPSRKDGVDLKKETYYRKSYCTFLQDLGMRLKVPQVTIATAIVFCHRFFLRQSHARNDRHMVATICMFLAGKVEETPRHLEDVIKVSYVCRHKKDPAAAQRIKQKEVFLQQKELILAGERLVLATLGFDLNIHHPYKPLVAAIKKFKVSQHALAQVAWNFVNDGLRTSLCLQFKPHHIAAGAIFLAAKFLKVKLPCDGERVWWQEFEVTPRQLEEVSNQMLELYEQNRPAPPPSSSDPSASADPKDVGNQSAAPPSSNGQVSSQTEQPEDDRHVETARPQMEDSKKTSAMSEEMVLSPSVNGSVKKEQEVPVSPTKTAIAIPVDSANGAEMTTVVATSSTATDKQDWGTIDEVNKDKLKAALEKRRKSRVECGDVKSVSQKQEATDEELLERELENGVEVAAEAERAKQEGNVTDDTKVKQVKLENGQRKDDRGRPESENTLKDSKRGHPLTTGKRERSDELPATGKRERSDELPTTVKRERSDELPTTVKRERSDELPATVKRERSNELPATVKRERSDELPTTVKRERTDELDPAAKRKRLNDEGYADKKSTRETVDAKPFDDRAEEGELPPSAAQEQSRSPRNGNERRASPPYDRRRDYGGRDQQPYPARREAFYDANKHRDSGYRHRDYYHHHPHHQYQQPHRDVEWHRPREAWIERDAKKMRYDHGK